MTLVHLIAVVLAIAAPDGGPANPYAQHSVIADLKELQRLRTELPEPKSYAKLLNFSEVASAMDYPNEALVNEQEGTSVTWLLVGTGGQAERCGIMSSSKSNALDAQTCNLLLSRARFEPARDESGRPIRSIFHQALTWQLEDDLEIANFDELKQLEINLPKPAKKAKLLNGADIASAMDYPKEALANEQAGTVGLLLAVGVDGRVTRCAIEASSGSQVLDVQSCNLFLANAQFQPARDRRGRAIETVFHQRMTWKLQNGTNVEAKDWVSRMSIIVAPDMEVRSCKSEFQYGGQWIDAPNQRCDNFLKTSMEFLLAAREKSKLHDAFVVIETWIVSSPDLAIPDMGHRSGETLVMLRAANVTYGSDGRRIQCENEASYGLPEYLGDVCDPNTPGALSVEAPKHNPAVTRNYRIVSAMYLKDEPN